MPPIASLALQRQLSAAATQFDDVGQGRVFAVSILSGAQLPPRIEAANGIYRLIGFLHAAIIAQFESSQI